jgi:hypothetical protein
MYKDEDMYEFFVFLPEKLKLLSSMNLFNLKKVSK